MWTYLIQHLIIPQSMVYGVYSTDYTALHGNGSHFDASRRSSTLTNSSKLKLDSVHRAFTNHCRHYNQRSSSWNTSLLCSNSVSWTFWRVTCRYLVLRCITPSSHFPIPTTTNWVMQSRKRTILVIMRFSKFVFFVIRFFVPCDTRR